MATIKPSKPLSTIDDLLTSYTNFARRLSTFQFEPTISENSGDTSLATPKKERTSRTYGGSRTTVSTKDLRTSAPILSTILSVSDEEADCDCAALYSTFELKARRSGKVRLIEAPCPHLKLLQRRLLETVLSPVAPHSAAMAFVPGRSIATNARRHHGNQHLLVTDIEAFFPSITETMIQKVLETRFQHLSAEAHAEILRLVTRDGSLPQGAPTSPHLANLVMFDFDERWAKLCERMGVIYTRYADDISVSGPEGDILRHLEPLMRNDLLALGLSMHPEKTRYRGAHQPKLVTGLDIGGARVRPTRAYRKKATALVRMSVKYPEKMMRHRERVLGYLAFWHGVDPTDPELITLLNQIFPERGASSSQQRAAELPF